MRCLCSLLLLAPLLTQAQAQTQTQTTSAPAPTVLRPGVRPRQLGHDSPTRPDRLPAFPGGEEALGEFFAQNVRVPAKAQAKKLTGSVLVAATVGPDGHLTDPQITQSLSAECDAEALRVVRLLPAWQPATRRGVPLPMRVQLPVPFNDAGTLQFEQDRRVPRSVKDAPGLN